MRLQRSFGSLMHEVLVISCSFKVVLLLFSENTNSLYSKLCSEAKHVQQPELCNIESKR